MASEIKVNKVSPATGTALQISDSGDTVTLPSGATLTIAGTANVTGTLSNNGTATGFGSIDWQTSDVKTSTFTAVAGKGYLVNTTSGAITVNLPAGSPGAQIAVVDYAGTWDTNACTLAPNGSEKIEGSTQDVPLESERDSVTILYQDSTQGWLAINNTEGKIASPQHVAATGGTITTSGDFKIHTFTGDGTFTVSNAGNAQGSNTVDYLVVAGGGGGGHSNSGHMGGGGGAGGFRFSFPNPATGGLSVAAQGYPISVGGGGDKAVPENTASSGGNSVFSSVTSAGGGGAGSGSNPGSGANGAAGGSGGGGASNDSSGGTAGAGNTPPVSPPQGNPGGAGATATGASGSGGGASGAGDTAPDNSTLNPGGAGAANSITGSPVTYSTGGFNSGTPGCAASVAANLGLGGNGARGQPNSYGSNGGSGIVVIRYKYQN
jgi:hypothetical protein